MVFSSMTFLCCALPLCVGVYFLLPRRWRNVWLLAFSLVFYAWGEPTLLALMLAIIAVNYLAGRVVGALPRGGGRRAALAVALAVDLGLLGWFKYAGFFTQILNRLLRLGLPVPQIALPIGISFYTFQSMSYVIDVYRGQVSPQENPAKLALYIAFFPQLIAGPIIRYGDVIARIDRRRETLKGFEIGLRRFIAGLGKKVLLANALAAVADEAFTAPKLAPAAAWIGAAAYALQIYYDFSGYSDMAIGLGRMFGFRYPENFDRPYRAVTVRDFWRRWHISLSSWFRDYVYIPLGGNRRGPARRILNLMIVFALTGLWHGAGAGFVLWGLWHGLLCSAEILLRVRKRRRGLRRGLQRAVTLLLVLAGWVLFRAEHPAAALDYLRGMFTPGGRMLYSLTPRAALTLVLAALGATALPDRLTGGMTAGARLRLKRVAAPVVLALSLMRLASGAYNPFIYFRF